MILVFQKEMHDKEIRKLDRDRLEDLKTWLKYTTMNSSSSLRRNCNATKWLQFIHGLSFHYGHIIYCNIPVKGHCAVATYIFKLLNQ